MISKNDYMIAYSKQTRQRLFDLDDMMFDVLHVCDEDEALSQIDKLVTNGLITVFEYAESPLYMLTGDIDSYPKTDEEMC